MNTLIFVLDIVGTISFAISGAMTGMQKNMDIFGVCMLGVTTAVGGGILRDLLLGLTPPATLVNPRNVFLAIAVSMILFFPFVRRFLFARQNIYDRLMLWADSAGLGLFTVYGIRVAALAGYESNAFLLVFVGVITGVGGGVIRDLFAGDRPYIFVKHIYACAAIAGAVLCVMLRPAAGLDIAMVAGLAVIVVIRLCSAKFRWSLPRARQTE